MQAPTQRKRDLALMQQIAKDKGGECLSTVFRGITVYCANELKTTEGVRSSGVSGEALLGAGPLIKI